ncbi:MAG TPA: DUF4142 domain-containing protein [Candidatus Udaeobacter sp.]
MFNFWGTILVDTAGIGVAFFGLLAPIISALIHVGSEPRQKNRLTLEVLTHASGAGFPSGSSDAPLEIPIRCGTGLRSLSVMKTNILLGTACAVLLVFPWRASAAPKKASSRTGFDPATFVQDAANINMTEIQLGKVAQEKGQSEGVKSFGDRMVRDHTKINDQLKPVAQELNLQMPEAVNAENQALIDKLSKLSGAEFDKAYANAMVSGHKGAIKEFENAQAKATQPQLKKFIDDTLPMLREHLELAKQIKGS